MKFTFHVTRTDGASYEVTAGPKQIWEFEEHFKVSVNEVATNPKMTHLYWLAWKATVAAAARGDMPAVKPFEDWLNTVDEIEPVGGDDGLDPLAEPPPTG